MSQPIYKFWWTRPTEAWYQLSEKEQQAHQGQVEQARDQVGGKTVLQCTPVWSNQKWLLCGVEEFPSAAAVQQHAELLYQLGHYRYFDSESMLGTEWPPK